MLFSAFTAIGCLASHVAAIPTSASDPSCPGVRLFVSRASQELPGLGIIGAVANATAKTLLDSDVVALDYPASFYDYVPSQTKGVAALRGLVKDFAHKCPNSKMVLMGYSQGAHVTADALCGVSSTGFPASDPLSKDIFNKVAAVILMGDPSHVAGRPYNVGSSKNSGMFPRLKPQGCDPIANKMLSFCDTGDIFCDGTGGSDLTVHMSYVAQYGLKAASFILEKIN